MEIERNRNIRNFNCYCSIKIRGTAYPGFYIEGVLTDELNLYMNIQEGRGRKWSPFGIRLEH